MVIVMARLDDFRSHEYELVRHLFAGQPRVLEIGGGTGLQAALIAATGADVHSIDVAPAPAGARIHFPVQLYDGRSIPFSDCSFDLIFSSNVLEHIADLDRAVAEMERVLKPGGMAIHILPTPAWRWWTSVAHYPVLAARVWQALRRLLQRNSLRAQDGVPPGAAPAPSASPRPLLMRLLLAGPHGEYPNAIAELWYFSRRRWLAVFRDSGLELTGDFETRLFYTGHTLLPSLSLKARQVLSRMLGSATRVYVLRKAA